MNFIKNIIYSCIIALVGSTALSAAATHENTAHERDQEAVQDFIKSKRMMKLSDKDDFMQISGDVRLEYIRKTQRLIPTLGDKYKQTKRPMNVKANIGVGYKTETSQAFVKLMFANNTGIDYNGTVGSGTSNRLALKEAWIQQKVYNYEGYETSAFLGRIGMDKKFQSNIQFSSKFNGFLIQVDKKFPPNWNIYTKAGAFVVDERVDHYAYVAEAGVLDFMEYKVDVIYNYIDWKECRKNRADTIHPNGFKFRNSQIYTAYNLPHIGFGFDGKIYGAFLYNHAAKRHPLSLKSRQNIAYYAGVSSSQGRKMGNITLKAEYQLVQAQAIPDLDMNGIGRGNFQGETFTAEGRGNGNYKGFQISTLYYFLDCLALETSYSQSVEAKRNLGGKNNFRKLASELILQF